MLDKSLSDRAANAPLCALAKIGFLVLINTIYASCLHFRQITVFLSFFDSSLAALHSSSTFKYSSCSG